MNDYLLQLVLQTPNDADLGRKVREYFNVMKNRAFDGSVSTTTENQNAPLGRTLLKG